MQVPSDVEVATAGKNSEGAFDLLLADHKGRRLLVRVLSAGPGTRVPDELVQAARLEPYEKNDRGNITTYHRIVLPLEAVTGSFKILLSSGLTMTVSDR
jgi:hypothetical protein